MFLSNHKLALRAWDEQWISVLVAHWLKLYLRDSEVTLDRNVLDFRNRFLSLVKFNNFSERLFSLVLLVNESPGRNPKDWALRSQARILFRQTATRAPALSTAIQRGVCHWKLQQPQNTFRPLASSTTVLGLAKPSLFLLESKEPEAEKF